MNEGDLVFVTKAGGLRFLPKEEAHGQDGRELADSSDRWVGVIEELRDNPDDTIVALKPSAPNTEPVRATLGRVRELFH